ncbi:MAG: T9SS type A sorting domain-containing protein [Bacteroidia bacterium]
MRLLIYTLFCALLSCSVHGQAQSMLFEKWWGTNDGCILYYADELPNGDYFLVGGRKSTLYPPGVGAWDNYVCRMDFRGNIIWEKEIGFPYAQDYAGGIVKTSWNTYLLVGTTEGDTLPGYRNIAVRNVDADGNVLFERFFTSGFFNDGGNVIETSDSCFVFLCLMGIPSTFNQATGMIKIDRNGNEVWRHRHDTLPGFFYQIKQTPDSGFIALGQGTSTSYDCVYAKFKSDGNLDWIKYPFGSSDTIPNYPSSIRSNLNGTFDIYYGTNYTAQNNQIIHGLLKHYDFQGNCLNTKEYFNPLSLFTLDKSDSSFCAITNNYSFYKMNSDSLFEQKTELEGSDSLYKRAHYYYPTRDGGYLGVGEYTYDPGNVEPQFFIIKFGDGRYRPDYFSESVNVYPNPSNDGNITLTFDIMKDDDVRVDIFTTEGKLIYTNSIFCPASSHTELPIRLFEKSVNVGMYIIEARTADAIIRKKLIVSQKP